MSKGYPSKSRVRKAFERGVDAGFRRRGARCPYPNARLAALWERGRQLGLQGRVPVVGRHFKGHALPKARPAPRPRRPETFGGGRRGGWR